MPGVACHTSLHSNSIVVTAKLFCLPAAAAAAAAAEAPPPDDAADAAADALPPVQHGITVKDGFCLLTCSKPVLYRFHNC